jgi:hypothetical protein
MTAVKDLTPGDIVTLEFGAANDSAVFVGLVNPHPIWQSLVGVLWFKDGALMLDCLSPFQEVGDVTNSPGVPREQVLRQSLLDRSQW